MTRTEIKLAGFGGQGIVLAGFILGKAISIYDQKNRW
jgi:2-oxoglutarate ferredoxin oxidoreductase subunit gamma